MLEVLQFIFQDFWHFIGALILLMTISEGVRGIKRYNENR